MEEHDFYRYKESAKKLLIMAIPDDNTDGENVHCAALWENIAHTLETLCNNFEGRGYDLTDVVSAYNEKKDAILDGIETSVYNGAMEQGGGIWNRILTAIEHLNRPLIRRTGDCATETKNKPTGGVFEPDIRLTTPKAMAMFDKFVSKGYIERLDNGHYKWLSTNITLSHFTKEAITYLAMEKRTWSVFERLFETKQLQSHYKNHEYDDTKVIRAIKAIFARNFQ